MKISTRPRSNVTPAAESVVIRFVGDSGDGMQLVGNQFCLTSATAGNDLVTMPDFPSEIRAPAGTIYGVSGFQLQFSSKRAMTPGDQLDVLVAMNPAALKRDLGDVKPGGVIIINSDTFTAAAIATAEWASDPIALAEADHQVHAVPMTTLTLEAVKATGLQTRVARRCINFFALGMTYWMYSRPLEPTFDFLRQKFASKPDVLKANELALKAGFNYGNTIEAYAFPREIPRSSIAPGLYRTINGNQAIAFGLVAAAKRAGLPLFFSGYPITPATSLMEELAALKHLGVRTMQVEDEIAGIGMAIGAAYGGALACTCTSGPGLDLKSEFISLATAVELPLVIVDVQRVGPSTGMPTKTEQSDLLMAIFGTHGDGQVPVIAASSPVDCFEAALEAARIALTAMTPVILLSDGYLANGSCPWLIPESRSIDMPEPKFHQALGRDAVLQPYARDPQTLARPWVRPGTPGCEHRIGGLEREHITGTISHDPENHDLMTRLRAEKVARCADRYPPTLVEGPERGPLLVVGWGSTYGHIANARERLAAEGVTFAHCHLRHLNPLPKDLGAILARYRCVLVPELNSGQLRHQLRAAYLVDVKGFNRVRGMPLVTDELIAAIRNEWEIQS